MFGSYPPLYSPGNEVPRKKAKGGLATNSWADLTPHDYGEGFGDGNYPHINKAHSLIESDNLIDTATLAPLIQTILIKGNRTKDKLYHPGSIVHLEQQANTVPSRHMNYANKVYWQETEDAENIFVFPEGFLLKKNEYRTVAVAVADAVEVCIQNDGFNVFEFHSGGVQVSKMQAGELYTLESGFKTPLICTYLYKGNSEHSHWVCIHNPDTNQTMYGV